MSYWYIASPYSKYAGGHDAAFSSVCDQAALLINAGILIFSPIAHTHPIAKLGMIDPLDHDIWMEQDAPFMDAARGLIVLTLDGWMTSKGVQMEIQHFMNADKPVIYMQPGCIPGEFLPTTVAPPVPTPDPTHTALFDDATQHVTQDRGSVYGHPLDDFARVALIKQAVDHCADTEIKHALEMIGVKLARLAQSPTHLDSAIDIAGYARTICMIVDERQRRAEHVDNTSTVNISQFFTKGKVDAVAYADSMERRSTGRINMGDKHRRYTDELPPVNLAAMAPSERAAYHAGNL